jgi:hypothetical protein
VTASEPVAPPTPRGPGEPEPGGQRPRWARLARSNVRSALAIRGGLSLAGAAVLIAVGVLMALHAVRDHTFPPYVAGQVHTIITSYSGPWLGGAIGVGAVAGLLLVVAVTDLWRRGRIGADRRTSLPSGGR